MIGPTSTVVVNGAVLGADLDQSIVLLSVDNDRYFELTDTSRAIWARLKEPVLVSALCDDLAQAYDAPPQVILADTIQFLNHLESHRLIAVVTR